MDPTEIFPKEMTHEEMTIFVNEGLLVDKTNIPRETSKATLTLNRESAGAMYLRTAHRWVRLQSWHNDSPRG